MNKKVIALTLLASMAMSGGAFAACERPDEPAIPDGESATGADMLKAKKAVEAYMEAAEAYMSCGIGSVQQERMVSDMERTAEKFNSQLRAYKAKT